MEYFVSMMNLIIEFMKRPIYIYGFEFSIWGIFIFVILATIVFSFIGGLFDL